jgi:ABC-type transporter Mla MlaB component
MSNSGESIATVSVTGPVTRAEGPRWRDTIRAATRDAAGLDLDLSASGPWDLAGVQILLAARASARRDGRTLRLHHAPGVLIELANQAGLSAALGLPESP